MVQPDGGSSGSRRRVALLGAIGLAGVGAVALIALALAAGNGRGSIESRRLPQSVPYTGPLPELPPGNTDRKIASPEDLEDLIDERTRAQAPLVAASDEIQRVVETHSLDGFAGTAIDDEGGSLILYWKGEIPEPIAAVIAASPARVEVRTAAYDRDELLAEAERIARLGTTRSGASILQVGPLDDYSGLMVVLDSEAAAETGDQEIDSPMHLEFGVGSPAVAVGS